MPVTLLFGPWSPDQADTPIQIPDTAGPLPVPCADCLNVIYTNGNYRSVASPSVASINGNTIQPMSAPPVSAFSYFDEVAQQETVFAGTGTGVQQLNPDGSWSIVNLITTQITSLIGQAMKLAAGSFANNNALRIVSMAFKTGVMNPLVTGIAFVSGTEFFSNSTYNGYNQQGPKSPIPAFGTKVLSNVEFGAFQALADVVGGSTFSFLVVGSLTDPTQGAFTTITSNGITQTSASAIYFYDASKGQATWEFGKLFGFASGTTYQVLLD